MREITILSGKGGTGKTSITAALASVAKSTVFCDNDVDAADLHLLLHPTVEQSNTFFSGYQAEVLRDNCNQCYMCSDYCRFEAIQTNPDGAVYINPFHCEGCRLCERICPQQAIVSHKNENNYWYVSSTRFGTMVHAKMGAGEENSGKLVTRIRKQSREIASNTLSKYVLNDGPPGIGCTAISSLTGTNAVLLVTEPSRSALHDVKRLVELTKKFDAEVFAVINKYDINMEISGEIEHFFLEEDIRLIDKLPYDKIMVEAMIRGKTIVEYAYESEIANKIKKIWQEISKE